MSWAVFPTTNPTLQVDNNNPYSVKECDINLLLSYFVNISIFAEHIKTVLEYCSVWVSLKLQFWA